MKRTLLIIEIVLILLFTAGCQKSEEKIAFEEAVIKLDEKNTKLDEEITSLQTLVDSGETPLDEATIEEANKALMNAHGSKFIAPEMAKKNDEIGAQAAEINAVDYTKAIEELNVAEKNLSDSIAKYKLVNNPSEDYILKVLSTIDHITGIEAATEENDPNGLLHKAGGYTSQVYFESDLVKEKKYGNSIVEKGTDCGGSIEVYETVEYAEKRNSYLSQFDGTVIKPGSHTVIGTVIVRMSDYMTATNQKEMEAAIIEALTSLNN